MIAFIDDHRGSYGVGPICKVLPIAPSTYRNHAAKRVDPTRLSVRAKRDMVLKIEIRRVSANPPIKTKDNRHTILDVTRELTRPPILNTCFDQSERQLHA
jgi:hypothetical protein